jgi:hypothetical protein
VVYDLRGDHISALRTGQDYEFLRDTHRLPRELVTELLREPR